MGVEVETSTQSPPKPATVDQKIPVTPGYFVEGFKYLYGEQYMSYNIHGLLHLASDAHHFGHLDLFSAFPFKNFMQIFKRLLRKGDKPLEQIIKRLAELKQLQKVPIHLKEDLICKYEHGEGPVVEEFGHPRFSRDRLLRVKDGVRKIIQHMIGKNVAKQFSWLGLKGKLIFSKLKVMDIIYAVATSKFKATRYEVEETIKNYLRHAGDKQKLKILDEDEDENESLNPLQYLAAD
uniref:DUF4806 domain-containing protein n=1 Tax=Strigamia maritima TaxID=126957 RepID=T1IKN9_STRMM